MIKTVLLVPQRDNSGRRFAPTLWRELEERLLQFGGFSRMAGVVGVWRQGDRVYRDVSRQYTVSVTSWNEFPAWLSVIHSAHVAFRQEAIYIEVAGVPEILESWPPKSP